jgi:radical SAM superfamily enzyme YgiQ (UPF0313 family)
MKILFVKLKEPVTNAPIVPSLGLWSMKAVARKIDPTLHIDILDEQLDYENHTIEYFLKQEKFDVVAISAMFSVQHFETLRIASIAKSYGARVIVGGIHGSLIAEDYPELFDDYCIGEGENWFLRFLGHSRFLDLVNFPNPYPERLKEEMFVYWMKKRPFSLTSKTDKWVPFETSRGCPRSCDFCIVPSYWGKWRPVGLSNVNDRLSYLVDNDVQEVFISDDNMSANKEYFLNVMERFKYYGTYWSTPNGFSAKTILDDRCFKAIAKTNCWQLQIAFDATTNKSAELIDMKQKFVEQEDALKISRRLKDAGIKSVGFFLIGYPGQTLQDMQETLDFANSLPLDNRHIHIATPYPGTVLYRKCVDNGWLDCKPHEIYSKFIGNKSYQISIISTPEFKSSQVIELRAKDREIAMRKKGLIA